MKRSRVESNAWIGPVAVALFLCGVVTLFGAPSTGAPADAQSPSGPDLYAAHCASCHQAGGEGIDGAFPPLIGNENAADPDYVESVIRDGQSGPIEVLGTAYDGVMPAVTALSDPEIAAVVDHVVGLAGPAASGDADPAPAESENDEADEVAGDVGRGEGLFLGSRRLDAGAPACGSCHVAGSVGDFGGGVLGPDLTDSFQTLGGEAGLTGWLANPPTETMASVFAERPLTEAEVADVVTFLADAPNQERPDRGFGQVVIAIAIGLVALIGLMTLAGRGTRQPYVAKLRSAR